MVEIRARYQGVGQHYQHMGFLVAGKLGSLIEMRKDLKK
jgi:hypothetical protein